MAGTPGASSPTPSRAAVSRLRLGLDAQVAAMSHEIDSDLDDVDRALADDREDLALEVLRGHIARLEAFAEGVRRTVAGSMAERDAEAVVDAVVATMPTPPAPRLTPPAPRLTPPAPRLTPPAPRLTPPAPRLTPPAPRPTPPAPRLTPPALRLTPPGTGAASPIRSGIGSGVVAVVRRGLLAAACLALAALIVGLGQPTLPNDPLSAALTASEQALIAAEGVTPGSPTGLAELGARNAELHRAIAELDRSVLADPLIRSRLESLLADQQQALLVLVLRSPEAEVLLIDLQRLAASLDLRLPKPVLPTLPGLPVVVLPAVDLDQPPAAAQAGTAGQPEASTPASPTAPPPAPSEATGAAPADVTEEGPAGGDPHEGPGPAADPAPADQPPADQPAGDDGEPAAEAGGAPEDTDGPPAPPDVEPLLEADASLGTTGSGLEDLAGG